MVQKSGDHQSLVETVRLKRIWIYKFTGKNITCNACVEKGRTGSTETLTTYIIEVEM